MAAVYGAAHVSLHVRISNRAALALGFAVQGIEKKYCERRPCARLTDLFIYLWHTDANGEDVYAMRLALTPQAPP